MNKIALKAAAISAVIIGAIDYAIWVYYPKSDLVDALLVAASVFIVAYVGMTKKR